MHNEAGLNAHGRAIARINALNLACNEPVANVIYTGAIVPFDGRAQQAELAHLAHDLAVEDFMPVGFEHT